MSIPPLVCSSPPPPDQCEDDKDQDDFDIPYNLSQDDDDSYNYGDFSSYNQYQSKSIAQKSETLSINIVPIIPSDAKDVNDVNHVLEAVASQGSDNILFGTNTVDEVKSKCDEDINIEDLCLEVNETTLSSTDKDEDKNENILNYEIENSSNTLENSDITDENNARSESTEVKIIVESNSSKELMDDPPDDSSTDLEPIPSEPISSNDELSRQEEKDINVIESNLDDDFSDYDDFQYASSDMKPSEIIENFDNPWDSNEVAEDNNFGNFNANFDAFERQISTDPTSTAADQLEKVSLDENSAVIDEDDDFGDFDDFKSSAIEKVSEGNGMESETKENLHVLNIHTSDNENQIMENITKVINSIFEEEISEPEKEFEGNLESTLSETWRHLRETDIRQPYMVNWNISLGQKTLLKALCIDSRNILFGPKWSYNMPKYAVNLGPAPLQPQKPLTPYNPPQNESVASKSTPKPGEWTDPFTADGQEFTYAEALLLDLEHLMATLDQMAHNHSTLKISELLSHACSTESESVVEVTASDLDVFEAAVSRKSDKIYSSTLNVQPLRQISLPDTHIFTPTDSETPTSKTVHYSEPPILLPATTIESSQISDPANTAPDINKDDDDYWEFQDFKSNSEKSSTSKTAIPSSKIEEPKTFISDTKIEQSTMKPNVTYQTQVLEPIRMEPLIPTVNWPDPGEIKETFDDFTDFASNSSWNEMSQPSVSSSQTEMKVTSEFESIDNTSRHKDIGEEEENPKHENIQNVDDEFDTFQSALPQKHITSEFSFDSLGSNTYNHIPHEHSSQLTDITSTFPSSNNIKRENISASSLVGPSESMTPFSNFSFPSNIPEIPPFKGSGPFGNASHTNLIPISANMNLMSPQTQQKSGQILQPLSLESYSQINWPNPGIDLQDLSRFNPVESLQSLKSDTSLGGASKVSSPAHGPKNVVNSQVLDDDWGEFVSSKPKQQPSVPKKPSSFVDDDEWTDFVSSPSVKPQNGLNTISLNVHTNSNIQKAGNINKLPTKSNQMPLDIPTLDYITPKTSGSKSYTDRHFQNL